jgi:membrane-associated phospholipid phosphatase
VIGPLLTLILSRYVFVWYVRRATIVLLVSIVVFVAVPSHTIRPLTIPSNHDRLGDNLTSWVYQRVVEIDDPPANAAPSLHVSLSCLLAWAVGYNYPRWWGAAFAGALLVWLSTLYTWQHHLIDVASGALLACLAAIGPPRPPPPVPDAGAP